MYIDYLKLGYAEKLSHDNKKLPPKIKLYNCIPPSIHLENATSRGGVNSIEACNTWTLVWKRSCNYALLPRKNAKTTLFCTFNNVIHCVSGGNNKWIYFSTRPL